MRLVNCFLILFYLPFFLSACGKFPIEVDCGYECEEEKISQEPTSVSATRNSAPTKGLQSITSQPQSPQPEHQPEQQVEEEYVQPTMFASNDWRQYAIELANKINKELIVRNYVDKSVYVRPVCSDPHPCSPETTAFNRAFSDFLITELVKLAVPTVNSPEHNTVEVTYKAQVVMHGKNFNPLDLFNPNGTKRFVADEVIIITSILLDNSYIFRDSGVYTIKDKDFWHYQDLKSEAATIKVAPKKKAVPQLDSNTEKVLKRNREEPEPIQQNT